MFRYGDTFDGKTTTLCVRRATYWDPELGREDPAKKGICSNFLCDAEPGTEITMTGLYMDAGSSSNGLKCAEAIKRNTSSLARHMRCHQR